MTRVDAHQHFWRLSRGDYRWLTPTLAPLYRDFEPEHFAPLLCEHAIARSVLVQAADSLSETEFLLALAARHEFVAGVVGWVDFAAPDAAQTIERLARDPKLVGLRPMIQDIDDDTWMLRPELTPAFEALARRRLCFDALVFPRHLPHLCRLVERHSELEVVVDHAAKPDIAVGAAQWSGMSSWRARMHELAAHPRVHVKLSGLVTQARPQWSVDDLAPFVDALFSSFGHTRVMWGSDWPVVELAGGYRRWHQATEQLLRQLGAREREAVLGLNAERFYDLPPCATRSADLSSPRTHS